MENNQEKKQFIFSLFQLAFDNVDQTTLIFKYEWNVILPGFNFTKESKGTMKFESVKKIMEMFRNKIGGRWNELVEWIPDDAYVDCVMTAFIVWFCTLFIVIEVIPSRGCQSSRF